MMMMMMMKVMALTKGLLAARPHPSALTVLVMQNNLGQDMSVSEMDLDLASVKANIVNYETVPRTKTNTLSLL